MMIIEIIDDFTLLALPRSYASQSFLKHKFMIIFLYFYWPFTFTLFYYSFYLLYHE